MKLAAFDLEIAKVVEEGDWLEQRPLGITCAAVELSEGAPHISREWWAEERLDKSSCCDIVSHLMWLAEQGYTIITVNGVGFDFDILAEESDMWEECADLALNYHCDMMMMSVCRLGWRVGLDALARGAATQSKLKEVTLRDGSTLNGMDGSMAPELWQRGEYDAVRAYLRQDVAATLKVAERALEVGRLRWQSLKGRWWGVSLRDGRLPIVAEMLQWPRPDTSWMTDPPSPKGIAWWALEALADD